MSIETAFNEEYEWVNACIEEMKHKPEIYTEEDHIGLPYVLTVLNAIIKNSEKEE